MSPKRSWYLARLGVPEWADIYLEAHAKRYGKSIREVLRDICVEKALALREEAHAKEVCHDAHDD